MKRISFIFSVILLLAACSATKKGEKEINQKLDAKTDKEIVLVQVVSDSRCPEGVQCVWAGEVTIEVAAYENKKLVEQTQFVLNRNSMEEATQWFTNHLPKSNDTLKRISVTPYPKEGVVIQPKEYKITLRY